MDVGDCPLPVVKHGLVFSDIYGNADTTSHGQTIYYTCEPGYVNGTDVPRCNNGTWTAGALCTPGNTISVARKQRSGVWHVVVRLKKQ